MIRKSRTGQYEKGRLVFDSERSAKLVKKWLRLKHNKIQTIFCTLHHGKFKDRAICNWNVNDIIKHSIVKMKRYDQSNDRKVSGHSQQVGADQDLLMKVFDLAVIVRASDLSNPNTVSSYLRFSQYSVWNWASISIYMRNSKPFRIKSA